MARILGCRASIDVDIVTAALNLACTGRQCQQPEHRHVGNALVSGVIRRECILQGFERRIGLEEPATERIWQAFEKG
ncbi:MAG: hypothetical protein H0T75_10375 [Rhizobiales bacterium]|nr:hypothetical protein [Hyphomicrobiales bacterium]